MGKLFKFGIYDPDLLRERNEVSKLLSMLGYEIVGCQFDDRYFKFTIQKRRKNEKT